MAGNLPGVCQIGVGQRANGLPSSFAHDHSRETLIEFAQAVDRQVAFEAPQAGDMIVERGPAHAQTFGQATQGELLKPLFVDQPQRLFYHGGFVQSRSARHVPISFVTIMADQITRRSLAFRSPWPACAPSPEWRAPSLPEDCSACAPSRRPAERAEGPAVCGRSPD